MIEEQAAAESLVAAGSGRRREAASGDWEQDRGDDKMSTNVPDPDVAALALSQHVILRKAIVQAGAVRDLLYTSLTEKESIFRVTTRMFNAASDALPHAPDRVDDGFVRAFSAARALPDPAAKEVRQTVKEEVEGTLYSLVYWGTSQAVADGFAAAFPDEAVALTGTSQGRSGQQTRLQHLSMLAQVFRAAAPKGLPDWPLDAHARTAFDRAARAVASRAADEAWDLGDSTFALAAAASAVMTASIPDDPQDFLHHAAQGICKDLSRAISLAGGSQELASSIPAAMLEGALEYPYDGVNAAGEMAVRSIRTAHKWVLTRPAVVTFRTIYEIAAGAAWATAGDRARFEHIHNRALGMAGRLDANIHYALDPLTEHSWKESPFDEFDEDLWKVFYGTSGYTVDEWVEVARMADYRTPALSPKNGALIRIYGAARNNALEAATQIAAKMQRTSR